MTTEWNKVGEVPVEFGLPILLGNPDWVDEDFNPQGVREGYYQQDEGFVAAVWNAEQDCWDATLVHPTYWMTMPELPL